MANHHATPGEVIDLRPLGAALADTKTSMLAKADGLEVIRLVLPRGKDIPSHSAPGPITVHCLEGRIVFTAGEVTCELEAGQMLYLQARAPHSLSALEDASVLVTLRKEL